MISLDPLRYNMCRSSQKALILFQFGGIHHRTVKNNSNGTFSIEEMISKIRHDDPHYPITSLGIASK